MELLAAHPCMESTFSFRDYRGRSVRGSKMLEASEVLHGLTRASCEFRLKAHSTTYIPF